MVFASSAKASFLLESYMVLRSKIEVLKNVKSRKTRIEGLSVRLLSFRRVSVKEPLQMTRAARVTELSESLRLYLADTLACDVKLLANLFESPRSSVV